MSSQIERSIARGASFLDQEAEKLALRLADSCGAEGQEKQTAETESAKESQSSRLVAFVLERCELFHDESNMPYAAAHDDGLTFRLESRAFKDWLSAAFFAAERKAPRAQSVTEAISTLSGIARHEGAQYAVHLRVGIAGGAYYLDLCEPTSSLAIELRPGSWRVVERPPVKFLRTEAMRPLPVPAGKGDLRKLWAAINIPDDKRVLVATWLIDALRPDTPFPLLELVGEAGSAKSTTQAILRSLVDPNACNLRSPPKSAEDTFIAAGVSWVVSFENVSHLSAPMQDALCVLATGGGFAKRRLYSDADESVIIAKRPIILNGISAAITQHDLADRAISIELPVIEERLESSAIWQQFTETQPEILAGILDLAAQALGCLPEIRVPAQERPRMLEFYKLGLAVGQVLGLDFKSQYWSTRADAAQRSIEASPVAIALTDWFEARERAAIEMTAKELLRSVEQYRPEHADAWPKTPKGFADALRRAAPSLRQIGIEVKSLGNIGGHVRYRVSPIEKKLFKRSHESHASHGTNALKHDIHDIHDFNSKLFRDDNNQRHDIHDLHDLKTNFFLDDMGDAEVF